LNPEIAAMPGMAHGGHVMPDGTSMGPMAMGPGPDGIEWEDPDPMMNRMTGTDSVVWKIIDEDTGRENMHIDWTLKQGTPVVIRIFNDPDSAHPMQHPIHFHGQRFLVAARDGVKEANLVWKDTVLVPAGRTVDIVLDTANPGVWMAHCHISEHLEASMMFGFKVEQGEGNDR
jgi:FtsP/CotA-like multicopper oxidase with cupredoxin domain